jgi:hypothetical protein
VEAEINILTRSLAFRLMALPVAETVKTHARAAGLTYVSDLEPGGR